MASKFFNSFQTKADALKRSTTRWADDTDGDNYPLSQAHLRNDSRSSGHEVNSDEETVESPRARFAPISSKFGAKTAPPVSSSVFANRPISALLQSSNQREPKVPTFKPGTLAIKPKVSEQQEPSRDLSAVLTKLSSMEGRIVSVIENRLSSLERKLEASEKRTASVAKAIEGISATVENQITSGLNISRGDLEHVMGLVNHCTKESGGILAARIDEIEETIAGMSVRNVPSDVNKSPHIGDDEVVVITANNPHDTVHKASVEELMSLVEGNKIYVCSSVEELKHDLDMVREADLTEEKDNTTEEV